MPLRLRRLNRKHRTSDHADSFSQAWGSNTLWKNTSRNQDQTNVDAARTASIPIQSPLPEEVPPRPLHKPPITRALLNKPLPPLPPEANLLVPPEKSPLRPQPPLADHPALRAQKQVVPMVEASGQKVQQARPSHTAGPPLRAHTSVLETARHASTASSQWRGVRKKNLLDFTRKRQKSTLSDDTTAELPERLPMVDRGTQTTPSLERPKPGLIDLPAPDLKEQTAKHSPMGKRFLKHHSGSSEEARRTPLWSPRSILKHDQPVDYFCISLPEETEDDGGIEAQFRAFLKNLRSAKPHSYSSHHRSSNHRSSKTTDNTDFTGSAAIYESKYSPHTAAPKVVRKAKSDDRSTEATKAKTPEVKARPSAQRQDTAPAVLATKPASSSRPSPPASSSRPLPLPLQKLASASYAPAGSPPSRQSRSDSAPVVVSPLRKELKRHDSKSDSPPSSGPGMNFKINRPRVIQLPPRGEVVKKLGSTPVTPEEEVEAADLFMYRVPFLKTTDDDEYLGARRVEQNVPEHFAGSPLCPMNPKHKSGGWGVCPYHGQRRVSDLSLLTGVDSKAESREDSLIDKRKSLSQNESTGGSRRTSSVLAAGDTRRSSAGSSNAWTSRKVSAGSEKGTDARKSSSGSIARQAVASRFSALDDDFLRPPRPTLGRQGSWAVGHNDGAVRGFGYEPPMPDPPTPPFSAASSISDVSTTAADRPQASGPGHSDLNDMINRELRNEHEPPLTAIDEDATPSVAYRRDHDFPIPRRRPERSSGEELKTKQDSQTSKPGSIRPVLNQGGRTGIRIDSSDSVPRFKMLF